MTTTWVLVDQVASVVPLVAVEAIPGSPHPLLLWQRVAKTTMGVMRRLQLATLGQVEEELAWEATMVVQHHQIVAEAFLQEAQMVLRLHLEQTIDPALLHLRWPQTE